MSTKQLQLKVIVLVLLVLGIGSVWYKNQVLGFSLTPEKQETVWTVESKITFDGDNAPAEVVLSMPENRKDMVVMDVRNIAPGYRFNFVNRDGERYGVWKSNGPVQGRQELFLRGTVYRRNGNSGNNVSPVPQEIVVDNESLRKAAVDFVASLDRSGSIRQRAVHLLQALTNPVNQDAVYLLKEAKVFGGKIKLARYLMRKAGLQASSVRGLFLGERSRKQKLKGYIEVADGDKVLLLNPRSAEVEDADKFLVWQYNDKPVLEVIGGSNSSVTFSTLSSKILASRAAVAAGKHSGNFLVDFSIYSLPVSEQNAFKLLLLIPIGALVIVILRNLVGISTSGTFMPILIALVFLHTTLLIGLALFLVVVSVGLILRSYLSHLNLLLVPRISAVLVFVIFIYVAIAVISHKIGLSAGLQITFFPMIIISWTIERMSVLWEEEGPKDVLVQGGGSLLSASLIYLVMQNRYVGHIAYSFPEILLVLLAIIIIIGSYSGYRLTELYRFEPMIKDK